MQYNWKIPKITKHCTYNLKIWILTEVTIDYRTHIGTIFRLRDWGLWINKSTENGSLIVSPQTLEIENASYSLNKNCMSRDTFIFCFAHFDNNTILINICFSTLLNLICGSILPQRKTYTYVSPTLTHFSPDFRVAWNFPYRYSPLHHKLS